MLPPTLKIDTIPWLPTLYAMLAGIAAARGEQLPLRGAPIQRSNSRKTG